MSDHSTDIIPSRINEPASGYTCCHGFQPFDEIFMFYSDLRRNARGALTLACSKKAINQTLDDNNTRLDPEVRLRLFHELVFSSDCFIVQYYSSFQETGEVFCKDNIGLLDDGQNQFCFASEVYALSAIEL